MNTSRLSPRRLLTAVTLGLLMLTGRASAADVDLTRATVVCPDTLTLPEKKAVAMLIDEVQTRTQVRWPLAHNRPAGDAPVIAVAPAGSLKPLAGEATDSITKALPKGAEGFRLEVRKEARGPTVYVVGNDARGVLFGVGKLLLQLRMARGKISVPDDLALSTAPRYPIRGHQIGYRPKTNSYDGWTLPMWEQCIRDLAVFGCNAIELIPPRSDDDDDSPHFPLPKLETMIGVSKLAAQYGIDLWIWYPALDKDYSDPKQVEFALKEWEEVFKKLPRIDAVFVPGGDPGHTRPKYLMALLEKQTANLQKYHPKAQMWVSPQGFTKEWMDEFLGMLDKDKPSWLSGVVHGPQVRLSLPDLRKGVPAKYPIRRYPDITHSLRCQYPVPDWDRALAFTQAREPINPRPLDEANIFRAFQDSAIGTITYSEGCNDDVNKAVWSALGWNPDAKVPEVLREYSRYFIGDRFTDDFASGLLALEKNWQGPLRTNEGVEKTLQHFQAMEKKAGPPEKLNWRFQQTLYRAYYDAYQRTRLLEETAQEVKALDRLRSAREGGALTAIKDAEAILDSASTDRVGAARRARASELAEALFQSIRMQLSVPKYQAMGGRGNTLDTIDVPLNDRVWLKDRFAAIRKMDVEADRLKAIDEIVKYDDPGPGGFYDDLGDPTRQPHLIREPGHVKDPGYLKSSHVGFNYVPGRKLSWCTHAETFYDTPMRMKYDGLDRDAAYKVRVVYPADLSRKRFRLTANDKHEVHPLIEKGLDFRPMEFDVPREATREGTLTLTWVPESGQGGNGRGCQVAEVWLIRK